MDDPIAVLDFWLGQVGPEGWYAGSEEIDAFCMVYADLVAAAREGGLEHWVDGTVGTLAYLILTDQLPRNIHRGTDLAFASDSRALAAARRALSEGWDLGAPEPERQFFYMPFEHSEDPLDQAQAVLLMQERMASVPEMTLHAKAHQEVIARFGRFPGRNAALGRSPTPEEAAFEAEGGYGALVRAMSHAGSA
jgi:uncharacterized protein (DUF924 family)